MARLIKEKNKRYSRETRTRNPVILIGCEGNNKSETIYFKNYRSRNYYIEFSRGNDTDPIRIINNLIEDIKKLELDSKLGDKYYCVIDTDTDKSREKIINNAITFAKKHEITVITSNPCFEVWGLCHFSDSTKQFLTSKDVKKELKNHLPGYEEGTDIFKNIKSKTNLAILNAEKLEKHHKNLGRKEFTMDWNPSTKIHEIIKHLITIK